MAKKQEIKCPWCNEIVPTAAVKTKHVGNDFGDVIERRCSKCNKLLAAYLEQEGEFLPKMRTF